MRISKQASIPFALEGCFCCSFDSSWHHNRFSQPQQQQQQQKNKKKKNKNKKQNPSSSSTTTTTAPALQEQRKERHVGPQFCKAKSHQNQRKLQKKSAQKKKKKCVWSKTQFKPGEQRREERRKEKNKGKQTSHPCTHTQVEKETQREAGRNWQCNKGGKVGVVLKQGVPVAARLLVGRPVPLRPSYPCRAAGGTA